MKDKSASPISKTKSGSPKSVKKQPATRLKGAKFGDPYEVFRTVFREEFGEEFVPGKRPKASSVPSPKPSKPTLTGRNTALPKKHPPKDDRALAGKTKTKQILHDNGQVETITTTVITRPNGKQEKLVKSSMEKLSKADQAKLPKATTKPAKHSPGVKKKQALSSLSQKRVK